MKSLIYFIFLIFTCNIALTQTNNICPIPEISGENYSLISGTEGINGEITSLKPYVSDTAMRLDFEFTFEADSYEQCDYLELTFPEGITPTGGSLNIYYGYLNPLQGQSISWGEDGNNPSLLVIYQGTYDFYVDVSVATGVSGNQTINYEFSDNLGSPAITGTLTLEECPAVPDLMGLPALPYLDYYTMVPVSQANFNPRGKCKNAGSTLSENTDLTLEVNDFYSESVPVNVPLHFWEEDIAEFPQFMPPGTGEYTFTFSANASNDWNPENASGSSTITVTENTLSYHNNIVKTKGNTSDPDGVIGNLFKVSVADTITAIEFYVTQAFPGNLLKAKIFNFDGTTVTDLIAQTMEVTAFQDSSWLTAPFAELVVLQPGDYLIGLCEGSDDELSLGACSKKPAYGVHWIYFNSTWHNMSTYIGQDKVFMINAIFGNYQEPELDAELQEIDVPEYMLPGSFMVKGSLKNNSNQVLNSIYISYMVDEGNPVTEIIYPQIAPLEEYEFAFSQNTQLSETGSHSIKVYLSNPNGEPDQLPGNDTIQQSVYVMEDAPQQMILGEEATGTWCGWCVRGHIFMDYMAEHYPDQWIGIAVHSGDPMEVTEYANGMNAYIQGYPNGTLNRDIKNVDPLYFEEEFLTIMDQLAPVEVFIQDAVIDVQESMLHFTVAANFYAVLSDVKFNAMLIEDGVTGTGTGYAQANYYSGGANGPMGGYELLPNPVPAEDMVYEHVARALPGGFYGVEGSLPDEVEVGVPYTWDFSVTLDPEWDIQNLKIVGVVADENTNRVMNACRSNEIAVATSLIGFDQEEIIFDTTAVNTISTETLIISNIGQEMLSVSGISTTNDVFSPDLNSFTLNPGESTSLAVTFAPVSEQLYEGSLVIESNDPVNGSASIPLSGYGYNSSLSLTLDFDGITNLQTKEWAEDGYDWEIYASGAWFATSGACSDPNGLIMNGGRLKLADGSSFNVVSADIRTWSGIYNATVRGYQDGVLVYEVVHPSLTSECEFYEYSFYDIDELEGFIGQTGVAIDNIFITFDTQNECDASLTKINGTDRYLAGVSNEAICTIKNLGTSTINSIELKWTIDDFTTIHSETFTGLNISTNETSELIHPDNIVAAPGEYSLDMWVENVNGTDCDVNPANDSASRQIYVVAEAADPKVLIEEFTTTYCQYCPGGHIMMDTLLANYDDFIGVAHHAGFYTDAMTIPAHEVYAALWASGAPTATINRISGDIGVDDWESIGNNVLNELPLGEVDFEGYPQRGI